MEGGKAKVKFVHRADTPLKNWCSKMKRLCFKPKIIGYLFIKHFIKRYFLIQ